MDMTIINRLLVELGEEPDAINYDRDREVPGLLIIERKHHQAYVLKKTDIDSATIRFVVSDALDQCKQDILKQLDALL